MDKPQFTVLEKGVFYPHYCRECRWEWYGKVKDVKMECPKCGEYENVAASFKKK